jgi:ADP-heptose:LPS heptosyltransferase
MKPFASEPSPTNRISEPDLQHMLVVQLDETSAVILLSPLLHTLRNPLPDTEITLMTSAASSEVAPLLPWVNNIMIDRVFGKDGAGNRSINPREDVAFVERLRRNNFSIALIFTGLSQLLGDMLAL